MASMDGTDQFRKAADVFVIPNLESYNYSTSHMIAFWANSCSLFQYL